MECAVGQKRREWQAHSSANKNRCLSLLQEVRDRKGNGENARQARKEEKR